MVDENAAYNAEAWLAQLTQDPESLRKAIEESTEEEFAALLRLIERTREIQATRRLTRPSFIARLNTPE